MSEKSNLFNRLTKLFRSGPVIKRNVRNITAQRGSTAVEVFKKAHSDVYNATLSAYGAFDRMCLDLDTNIAVPGKEKFLTLRQLMELYPNGEQFVIYAFDHETNSVVPAWAHHLRSSGVRKTAKVTFDDGSFLVCTPDHPCMLRNGTFKDAGELEVDQSMARYDSQANHFCYLTVASVEPWLEIETGDLTVDGYENFATDTIIVHNSRYSDFAEMESTPEICSALDIYAEETVSPDEHGKVLHVYSDNRKVHELLTHLFYDVLNVEFNLVMWVRNLVKYGDFFLFNDINPEYGVINAYPISISEIEREEGYDPNDPAAVRFRWVTQGNQLLENWQISHFRLLGNDAFLPYGSSVLEGARRIWRQLILIEDAMLVYRVIRAPERRVFYIDVGNVPPEEVANYLEQVQTSLKRNQIIDRKTGKVDLRYNPLSVEEDFFLPVRGGESGTKIDTLAGGQNTAAIEDVQYIQNKLFAALKIPKAYIGYDADIGCLTGDTKIPLLDGRTLSIKELVDEYESGKINWVYSFDSKGSPKPGKINKAWLSKRTEELCSVKLDNGQTIVCTPNHPFMLHDGSYLKADELKGGESLMALYREESSKKSKDFADGYEKILNHFTKEWEFTHRMVANNASIEKHESCLIENFKVIHHKTFDKKNNNPDCLQYMGRKAHALYHASLGDQNLLSESSRNKLRQVMKTDEYKLNHREAVKQAWKNDDGDRKRKLIDCNIKHRKMEKMQLKLSEMIQNEIIDWKGSNNPNWKERPSFDNIVRCVSNGHYSIEAVSKELKCSLPAIREVLNEKNYDWMTFVNQFDCKSRRGRKLVNLDITHYENIAKHCATRREFHKKIDLSRFGFESYLKRNEILPKDWYAKNIGISNHKVVSIEFMKFEDPIDVYDLEIEDWHNFALAAGIVVHNSKATLSQEDIRFSRTIQRIQKTVISELNKIAQIHLYCHGYDGEDLADFELHLSNPSTVAQMQKLELIRTRFEIAGAAPEGSVNRAWIQKNVLGLTDAEIEEVKVGRISDKKNDLELEAVTADGGDEGGDAGGGDESGDDEGGGLDDLLGGGDEGGGEDLTAGDAKSGDLIVGLPISPSSSVQTKRSHNYYGEADEPIDIGSLSILDANAPLKAAAAIHRNGIEEDRNAFGEDRPKKKARRKGKRLRTAMPDLLGMVNHERSRDSLKDPFGRTTEPAKLIDENSFTPPRVTFDLVRTLSKMSNVMGIARKHNALLNESEGEGDPDGEA
jgi:intein/homing endonuclease